MKTDEVTQQLFAAKMNKGKSFSDLGKLIGRDEVWVAALFYGQARASEEEAAKLTAELGLGKNSCDKLTDFPAKGFGPVVPTDTLIYRC